MRSRAYDVHWPFPTPVVTGNTEDGSTSGTEEEGEGDGGRDGGFGDAVEVGEGGDGQGNGMNCQRNCEKELTINVSNKRLTIVTVNSP